MNQPESGRATAEDIAWIRERIKNAPSDARTWLDEDLPRYARILKSLVAPAVPVADRERLARALYIVNSSEHQEPSREAFWESGEPAISTREHWLGEADRLVRVLGGFPVATERESPMLRALHEIVEQDRDIVIQYDEEDGFWLSEIERGNLPLCETMDDAEAPRRPSVAAAIAAAVDYHNLQATRPHTWRKRIDALVSPSPAPVVQQEPFVWLARPRHGFDRLVWSREEVSALGSGWTVTPLYALETYDG